MNYIIGIAGKSNSGKDTIANMINYIYYTGIAKANYINYITMQKAINITCSNRIIHFADALKDVVSILYGIDRKLLDERDYKDYYWYCLDTGKFVEESEIHKSPKYNMIIGCDMNYSLADTISTNCFNYIKIRNLLQYVGTDICRKYLSDDIWVKATMRKAVDIAEARKLCIIPDVRFNNEAKAIHKNDLFLYGGVIKVIRDVEQMQHSSEDCNVNADYVIENNGTLNNLFYKVLNIVNIIMNKNES